MDNDETINDLYSAICKILYKDSKDREQQGIDIQDIAFIQIAILSKALRNIINAAHKDSRRSVLSIVIDALSQGIEAAND